jgi:hypothetical protein
VTRLVSVARVIPREVREFFCVLVTALLHLGWPEGVSRAWFIAPMILSWTAHVLITARRDPTALDGWGLRWGGLRESSIAVGLLLSSTIPALLVWGWRHDAPFSWTLAVSLLLYPAWGLVQQLMVQGMVTRTLARLPIPGSVVLAVVLSAALFGMVHVTEPLLVPATFGLGLVLAPIWLRWRNLWPLGLAHGWIGAVAYIALLHRDPVRELLGHMSIGSL